MANHIAEQILRVALQRLQLIVLFAVSIRLGGHPGPQIRSQTDQVHDLNSLQALQENHHVPVGHFYSLVNFGECSDFVQVRSRWVFHARIQLRDYAHQFLFAL